MKKFRPVLAGLAVFAVVAAAGVVTADSSDARHHQFMFMGTMELRIPGLGAIPQNYGNNTNATGGAGGRWGCFFTCGGVPCLVGGKFNGFVQQPTGKDPFSCSDMQAVPGFGLEGLLIKPWGGCGAGNPGHLGYIRINKNGQANARCG